MHQVLFLSAFCVLTCFIFTTLCEASTTLNSVLQLKKLEEGLLWCTVDKNLPANAEDTGLILGLGRFHMLLSS